MNLNLEELKIIEGLLQNRLNVCYEYHTAKLLEKVKRRIFDIESDIKRVSEWIKR